MTSVSAGLPQYSYIGANGAAAPATRNAVAPAPLEQLLIGNSVAMHRVRALIQRLAPTDIPVVIHGPTGAGKELVAQALHSHSGRSGAFVALNVCAVADGMFEDALFGHVRGAFTGATHDSAGYLAEADGGTMFLDEIAGLSLQSQAKLLRAIETQQFRPVGGRRDRSSRFRVVVATNEDLNELANDGRFRIDLLHRLQGAVVHVPALDQRREDIVPLARLFATRYLNADSDVIAPSGLAALQEVNWPGNVRELMQVVQCASMFAERGVVDRSAVTEAIALRSQARPLVHRTDARDELVAELEAAAWDVDVVARHRGVHRATVYRQMQRLCIDRTRVVRHD